MTPAELALGLMRSEKVLAWGLERVTVPRSRWCEIEEGCAMNVHDGFLVDGVLIVDGVLNVIPKGAAA